MLVAHLISDLGCKRIALFRQDDSFGDAGRIAVVEALHRRGLRLDWRGGLRPEFSESSRRALSHRKELNRMRSSYLAPISRARISFEERNKWG